MKQWIIFTTLLLMSLQGLAKLAERPPSLLNHGAQLEWTNCWFVVPVSYQVQCGYFYPSDYQQSSIRLPVVIIKSRRPSTLSSSEPLLYLTGGPGVATGLDQEGIENWWQWLENNPWSVELVLFDQRGTGLSQPQLDCPEIRSMITQTLGQPLSGNSQLVLWQRATKNCYQRLQAQGIELSHYTSTRSSHDVGELMAAIGGFNWNLYGVSYGTRLALTVEREYPERIRSVILDSVYPPEVNELLEFPFVYDNALNILFKSCQADTHCHQRFPQLEANFFKLLKKLQKNPITLLLSQHLLGDSNIATMATTSSVNQRVVVNSERFMEILFDAMYSWDVVETLPATIEATLRGEYESLRSLVQDYVEGLLSESLSYAVYLSVECHDRTPHTSREEFLAKVAQYPRVRKFVAKQWDYDLCQIWKVGDAGEAFRQPVNSKVPTLFLGGEYDPVTPPNWASQAVNHFQRGYLVVLPGSGHGVVDSDYCASKVVGEFLTNPWRKPYNNCLSWPREVSFVLEEQRMEKLLADNHR